MVEDFDGRIYEITRNGGRGEAELFFDVKAAISAVTPRRLDNTSIPQGGLRAVAFHPEFESNGLLYTSLMETRSADLTSDLYLSNVTNPIVADSVLVEWQVDQGTGRVDPNSYRQVFRVGMPVYDHAIKQVTFNPFSGPRDDDYGVLYVPTAMGRPRLRRLAAARTMMRSARHCASTQPCRPMVIAMAFPRPTPLWVMQQCSTRCIRLVIATRTICRSPAMGS